MGGAAEDWVKSIAGGRRPAGRPGPSSPRPSSPIALPPTGRRGKVARK